MASIWTRYELNEQIAEWKKALKACATGKSYTIGSRNLTRYDLDEIRDQLEWLASELNALENGRGPVIVQSVIPRGHLFPYRRRS